mmetsp:Transcript_5867/g.11184  ORF Transcript_5867/g.11184 Transcript_5867/m.11184 type:complete len:1060 (+) Transcript_5867:347-3526(+)
MGCGSSTAAPRNVHPAPAEPEEAKDARSSSNNHNNKEKEEEARSSSGGRKRDKSQKEREGGGKSRSEKPRHRTSTTDEAEEGPNRLGSTAEANLETAEESKARILVAREKRELEMAKELIESCNHHRSKNDREIKMAKQTQEDEAFLARAVEGKLLFNNLPLYVVRALTSTMYVIHYQSGEELMLEGMLNPNLQKFYVVQSGKVDVYQHVSLPENDEDHEESDDAILWTGGERVKLVQRLSPGMCFGEDRLLYNKKDTTAKANGKAACWALDQRIYIKIKYVYTKKVEREKKRLVKTVQSFTSLSDVQLGKVLDALEPASYEEGEKIVVKGEVGDRFFILQEGEVAVQEEEGVTKLRLGAGSFFGEKALLADDVRSATVMAVGAKGATCWYLDREAFQDLLGPVEDVWRWATLRAVPLLSALSDDQLMALVDTLRPRKVKKGQYVFKKDMPGDSMYVVEDGNFQVLGHKKTIDFSGHSFNTGNRDVANPLPTDHHALEEHKKEKRRKDKDKDKDRDRDRKEKEPKIVAQSPSGTEIVLTTLQKGAFFGEYALLSQHPRTASVRCCSEGGLVLELSHSTFTSLLGNLSNLMEQWRIQTLRRVPLLANLSTKDKQALVQALVPCSFEDGTEIYAKGSEGETMYIVEKGHVLFLGQDGEATEVVAGQFFGEQALMGGRRRTETVKAVGTPLLLSLSRSDVTAVLGEKLHSLFGQKGEAACAVERTAGSETKLRLPTRVDQLEEIAIIGVGGYGKVTLVNFKNEQFALKSMLKQALLKMELQAHLEQERESMIECRSPWTVGLDATYQDKHYVFMLIEAVMGGDLRRYILKQPNRRIPENHARFYVACVVQALEFMHSLGYVHRDLKTENLLITPSGYIKLADFGFAKKIIKGKKTYTTCGTPAYMAPEIITMAGHTTAVDWWCIGILLYEMTCGYTPFQYETNELNKLRAIVDGKYTIPSNLSASCRSIISKLLTTNPARRLGNLKRGARDVKAHPWFNGFSWTALQNMEMKAPFQPELKSEKDLKFVKRTDNNTLQKIAQMEAKYKDPPKKLPDKDQFPNF